MTFDGNAATWESAPTEAVPQAEASPAWARFETDEIDGSLCDLPPSDNLERIVLRSPPR